MFGITILVFYFKRMLKTLWSDHKSRNESEGINFNCKSIRLGKTFTINGQGMWSGKTLKNTKQTPDHKFISVFLIFKRLEISPSFTATHQDNAHK